MRWTKALKAAFEKVYDASKRNVPYIVRNPDSEYPDLTKLVKAGYIQPKFDGYMTTLEGVTAYEDKYGEQTA